MKYNVRPSTRFQKDLKSLNKRGYDISLITKVIKDLADGLTLDRKFKDHALSGEYKGCREYHIISDWLLIYEISEKDLFLYLTRTGTHSDLF